MSIQKKLILWRLIVNKKVLPHAYGDTLPKQYEMPGQSTAEVPCSDHPSAPHGFLRNASHNNNRYTCECEGWEEQMRNDVIESLEHIKSMREEQDFNFDDIDEQISYIKGLMPIPEEHEWRNDPTLCYECGMPKDGQHKMGCQTGKELKWTDKHQ